MSVDWAITPPSSPVFGRRSTENVDSNCVDDKNQVSFKSDWDRRMFCCMGEHLDKIIFHESSYLSKNDLCIFDEESSPVVFVDNFSVIKLFGFNFDRGSALLKDVDTLFKMAKSSFMQLDTASKTNVNNLGINATKKNVNYAKYREDVVDFMIYIRNYVQRICLSTKYRWLIEILFPKLFNELISLRLLHGSIEDIPDYVINYSANSSGNKCTQVSYHLFHYQLDLRWLHLTLLYQLISYKQRFKNGFEESQSYDKEILTFETFENNLLLVVSDLVLIALKKFQHLQLNDLPSKPMFTCSCIREFWKMVQISADKLNSKEQCMSFWNLLNKICENLNTNRSISPNCSKLSLPKNYSCSNSSAFILWILKDLSRLFRNDKDSKSNYQLLENVIKSCISSNVSESYFRIYLNLIERILNSGWEMRTEPLILLWEHFHKKLNLQFFIPGSSIGDLAVVSKSALGFLNQINSRLDASKCERNADSFHLFLRLLGRSLRKWQESPRFWNQLKGRIYSKFSAAKLSTLNETGLYHFISLFLTLAVSIDSQEVSNKLQSLLKLLPVQDLDHNRLKLVWKAHIALILLFAERNQDISGICNPLLDLVEPVASLPEYLNLMRIFSEGFQDLIDSTNNLELGQYILIGNWIPQYLSYCNESDANRLLDSLLSLINKLNSVLSLQLPVSQDNQLLLLHHAVWEHLSSYLKKESSNSSSPFQISDIAALLTTVSMKSCFPPNVRNRAVDFFTYFITSDVIDIRLLCRYLGQTSRCNHLHYSLNNHSIILIKGWLRCLILISNSDGSAADLQEFTKYVITLPEVESLLTETDTSFDRSADHFEIFLVALERKYAILQDFHSKTKFANQVASYLSNTDRWLSLALKVPKSAELAMHVYHNFGLMVFRVPYLLYTKSRSNTLLQIILDLLLLSVQVRNPQIKMNPFISEAIKNSLHLYVKGLFKLDPLNDMYISRSIRELVTIYVSRLIVPKGTITTSPNCKFSLLKCFDSGENSNYIRKTVIEMLCNSHIKKKAKTPHQYAFQTLIFFNELARSYRNNNEVICCFIKFALEKTCDVFMFCEDISPCKKEAKDIIHFLLDMHMLRNDSSLGNELMNMFSRLCHENLAFNARVLFDLFEDIVTVAPDLVTRFIPRFLEKIKEVEFKRGVGFDRALRKGLERIEDALKNIRNNQKL